MAKAIIALSGPIASGKDTVKKYLIEKFGAASCRFSTILRDVLNRIKMPDSRENMQALSTILRKTFGEELLARVIAEDASGFENEVVAVDGVRRLADIKHLSALPGFVLVAIDAKPELRYERLVKRAENPGDANKTYKQFLKNHDYETETSIPAVMKKADYCLNNDGNLGDLYKQVDDMMKKILH